MRWLATALLCWPMLAQALYPCVPKEIGGSGTYYRLTAAPNAYALQWVCTDATGKASIYGPVWRKNFAPSMGCAAALPSMTLTGLPDPIAAANAAAAACRTLSPDATGGYADPDIDLAFRTGVASIRAAWAADHPASGPLYRVPSGGSAVYPVANGKLGVPIPNRRAPGNALCDLVKLKVVVGAYTYGAFDGGGPAEAALCVKV